MQRREFIAGLAGAAAWPLVARAQPVPSDRVKGPLVWLDMDQKELDEAYDQRVYAPNMLQVMARCEHVGDLARKRIGEPKRCAYGPSAIEGLDLYATKTVNAPVNIFVHGGAVAQSSDIHLVFPRAPLHLNGFIFEHTSIRAPTPLAPDRLRRAMQETTRSGQSRQSGSVHEEGLRVVVTRSSPHKASELS